MSTDLREQSVVNVDLLDATSKAAETFRDLAVAMRLLNQSLMAEACDMAEAAMRAAVARALGTLP